MLSAVETDRQLEFRQQELKKYTGYISDLQLSDTRIRILPGARLIYTKQNRIISEKSWLR